METFTVSKPVVTRQDVVIDLAALRAALPAEAQAAASLVTVTDIQPNWEEDDQLIADFTFLPTGDKFFAAFEAAHEATPPQIFAVKDSRFFGLNSHLNRGLGKSITPAELSPLFEAIRVAYDY